MRRVIVAVSLMMLGATPAWSADAPTLAERAEAIERASTAPDGYRVVLGRLSRELTIDVPTLRAQRTQTGLSWGELLVAHRLARAVKIPLDQVVADFRGGKRWEDIARDRGVDLNALTRQIEETQVIVEHHADDKAPPKVQSGGASPPDRSYPGSPVRKY
jgi:hypothetical protein